MPFRATSRAPRFEILLALCLLAAPAPAPADDPPDYLLEESHDVVVGGEELAPLMSGGWWDPEFTFYNSTALKIGNRYAIWAQTGWDAAGCLTPNAGLDQIAVFTSTAPDSGFQPRACNDACGPGTVSQSTLRASLATECVAEAEPWMWGLGDVIRSDSGGNYLATFDLSREGFTLSDWGKYEFTLASSDGLDRTSDMHTFARIDPAAFAEPVPRMVDPVPFRIDNNTVGVLFHFFSRVAEVPDIGQSVFCCSGTGFMVIDFTSFPGSFTVRVLDENNVYRTLNPSTREIDFRFKNLGPGSRRINRVQRVDGQWVAFFSGFQTDRPGTCASGDRGSNLAYRPFFLSGGLWGGWLDPVKGMHVAAATGSVPLEWDNLPGLQAPSPLVETKGIRHFYYTRDTECTGSFGQLDIVHAGMEARNANLLHAAGFELGVLQAPLAAAQRGILSPNASPVHEGIYSLEHIATGNDSYTIPWRGWKAPLMDLHGEETFRFSVWAQANQNATVQLFLFCLDEAFQHQQYGATFATFTATPSWQLFEHSRTCPDGASYVSARLDNNQSGKIVWWDDVRLVDSNLLQDGAIESGYPLRPFNTIRRGQLSVATVTGRDGELTSALKHVSTGNDSYTDTWQLSRDAAVATVTGAQTFRLSAWARATTATSGQLFIYCLDQDFTRQFGGSFSGFTVPTFWQQFEHTRACPAGTRYVSVRLDNNTAGRTIYWDDLRLEVVE